MATLIHENQIQQAAPTRIRPGDQQMDFANSLAADLRDRIEGEVRFDAGSRALYSTDGSNYRQVPIGVVVPRSIDDVVATVAMCRRYGAPILARGGGTSLAGQCCNIAVVLDFSKYLNQIVELNHEQRYAWVQPGIVLDWLRNAAEKHQLTFGPDPATHNHNTIGGMIGNNSCGIHALMAGKTEENIDELDILTYDGVRMRVGKTSDAELDRIIRAGGRKGQIYAGLKSIRDKYADEVRKRYPNIPRRVSGYNLNELLPENGFHVARALVGTECTCVMVLQAKCRLVPSPPGRTLVVLGYPDVFQAGDHVPEILQFKPIGLEGLDALLIDNMKVKKLHPSDIKLLPDGRGWLLVEFGAANKSESDSLAKQMLDQLKQKHDTPSMKLYDDPAEEALVWEIREAGLGATAWVPGEHVTWEGWEDSAVPPDRVGPYLRDLCKLYDKFGYKGALYGHFGQGCIHTRITFDLFTSQGIQTYRSFMEEAADLVIRYGGSLSGEHGDGQSRAEFLPKMFGPEIMQAFHEFKSLWDPEWKMNPGKVLDAYKIDENLRYGADFNPPEPETHFKFVNDRGSFNFATMRCVGVGECRRHEKGAMCPSYRATLEEKHSTRGRARMLFEMMSGEVIRDGWKSDEVLDSLDLCLSCKGCKHDCPVNVDMATYKAEFLSHYYEGRLRPRHAYSMGWIYWWARAASLAPDLVNLVMQTPGVSNLAKWAGGIAPQRPIPKFAHQTFKDWYRRRGARNLGKPEVILWPDTFNNYFHPEVAAAATEVLEHAGFRVLVPSASLCCGRPLYDFGFLDTAQALLKRTLTYLEPKIESGIPMVGLEPSCTTVFRDELIDLLPNVQNAKRLNRQTFTLAEFLREHAPHYKPPQLQRKAVVHGHCHHKAVIGLQHEEQLLKDMGLNLELPDDGCCGMAGSFGFEADKYDISMKIGETKLLPRVRHTPHDTLIVADGFSCKTQIEQATDRHALHVAQLLQMALQHGPGGVPGDFPERKYLTLSGNSSRAPSLLMAGLATGLVLGGGLLYWNSRHNVKA